MKNIILEKGDQSGELLKVGGKSVIKAIREDIAEKGNEDLAFKAVDDVIKTGETAVAAKDIIVAGTNGVIDVAKAVKNAPQTAKSALQKVQDTKRKYDAYKNLQKKQKMAVIKSKAKKVAEEALKSAKSAAIKVLALLLVNVVIIIAICGVVIASIGSFIWQTSSDLDTTAIIKLISEKDCKQQENWMNKGYKNIELEAKNDNNSDKSYKCVYALSVDKPLDDAYIKTAEDSDGEELTPTYGGFNKVFSSSDEMLEIYRWTTDDSVQHLRIYRPKKIILGGFQHFSVLSANNS